MKEYENRKPLPEIKGELAKLSFELSNSVKECLKTHEAAIQQVCEKNNVEPSQFILECLQSGVATVFWDILKHVVKPEAHELEAKAFLERLEISIHEELKEWR